MRVTMRVQMSGTINGTPWPPVGEQIDVPDEDGAGLCAAGAAEPVDTSAEDVETAVAPKTATTRRRRD